MRKRKVSLLVAGLFLVVTGCGSGESEDSGASLTYAVWNKDQVPALKQLAKTFEATHRDVDIKIQLTPFEQYWTKLQASAAGGSAPDVFWMNGVNAPLYASNDMLLPLPETIGGDPVDLSVYPASLVDLYRYQGEQYGLPRDMDTVGLWYNKELFEAAGVRPPDASWTWDDLREAARKLTDRDRGVHGIAAAMMNQENYYNTIAQAGGQVVSADGKRSGYDDPATIEGLRLWTDLIERGHSPSMQQMTDTDPLRLFESGKVAMYYGGSWRAIGLNKNENTKNRVDVAPLPRGVKQTGVIHGLANSVYAKTEHPEEALEFVRFLGSRKAARVLGETGTVIPAYEGTRQDWVASMPQFDLKVFLDGIENAVPYPVSKNTAAWQAEEAELLPSAWAGTKDVATVARQLATAMNAHLAKEAERD